jgi:hypothetical protein
MGALLRGVKREQMKRGQVIIAPGSMKPITKFQAQIYVSTSVVTSIRKSEPVFRVGSDKGRRQVYQCVYVRYSCLRLPRMKVAASIHSLLTTDHNYFFAPPMLPLG